MDVKSCVFLAAMVAQAYFNKMTNEHSGTPNMYFMFH